MTPLAWRRAATRVCLVLLAAAPVVAVADERPPERIVFQAGRSTASVKGSVAGYEYRDYLVAARAHQVLSLTLQSTNRYANFRIVSVNGRPDEKLMPAEASEFAQELSDAGDYVVRVLMMRTGARKKGAVAAFTLNVSLR